MKDLTNRFEKMNLPKGHLLTIKDDVQKIRDAFFSGKAYFRTDEIKEI